MTEIDLSSWLTKAQVADRLQVSTKQVERFHQAGKLEQRFRAQAGSPRVAVYFPDDVDKLVSERQPDPAPFVLPARTAGAGNGNGREARKLHLPNATSALTPSHAGGDADPVRAFAMAVVAAVMSQTSETSPVSQTSFLTIAEASAFTGLSQAYLRRQIRYGTLPAVRDRGWRIRRKDLEQL